MYFLICHIYFLVFYHFLSWWAVYSTPNFMNFISLYHNFRRTWCLLFCLSVSLLCLLLLECFPQHSSMYRFILNLQSEPLRVASTQHRPCRWVVLVVLYLPVFGLGCSHVWSLIRTSPNRHRFCQHFRRIVSNVVFLSCYPNSFIAPPPARSKYCWFSWCLLKWKFWKLYLFKDFSSIIICSF